jgi:glycosyltransferase involved in cell wall biosynthesis
MFGFSNDKMLYNLLTSSYSTTNPSLARKDRLKKVVFVGRLVKEKNLKMLLNCFDRLSSDKLELHIIGDGLLREELEHRKLKRVVFQGFRSTNYLQKTLNTYDAFILPSIHEQWSVSIHEAALSGLLLLSSKYVGANSEFLIEGFNGFNFDPRSEQELTQVLINLADMPDERLMTMKSNSLALSIRRSLITTTASFLSMKYKKSAFY